MTTQTGKDKAAQLRAKTDRQLMKLINRNLDRALLQEDHDSGDAYSSATRLLTVAYGATYAERRRAETKLAKLAKLCGCGRAMFASVA
jgi:hypothetical protein